MPMDAGCVEGNAASAPNIYNAPPSPTPPSTTSRPTVTVHASFVLTLPFSSVAGPLEAVFVLPITLSVHISLSSRHDL